ncbi:hypothetical protein ACFSTA_12415 [Ornithinibacillus salinisoli]|uniref:Uncharacterized protein n=1 Tax=Ornithinibacillus salinisoli TaxID=1848459 RepID=A0ABW4W5F0_9BACI
MDFTGEIFTRARKLNIYLIPQYSWLILLYYLMINAFYKIFIFFEKGNSEITLVLPEKVTSINVSILNILNEWNPFLLFLSITLFLSGIAIAGIYYLPILKSYKFSYRGAIGIYLGSWLFLIVTTIWLFDFLGAYFVIIIPVCAGITSYWEENLKYRLTNL